MAWRRGCALPQPHPNAPVDGVLPASRRYGYVTNTWIKLVTVVDEEEVKDAEMRAVRRKPPCAYPFTHSHIHASTGHTHTTAARAQSADPRARGRSCFGGCTRSTRTRSPTRSTDSTRSSTAAPPSSGKWRGWSRRGCTRAVHRGRMYVQGSTVAYAVITSEKDVPQRVRRVCVYTYQVSHITVYRAIKKNHIRRPKRVAGEGAPAPKTKESGG